MLETNCTDSRTIILARHLRSLWPKGDPPTPRGTWGNLGETRGGVGKSGVLDNKSTGNISETRIYKDRGKVTMDGHVDSNSPTLFRTIQYTTPYGLPFPKIRGSQPHLKLQSKISGKRVPIEELMYVWRAYRNSPTLFRTVGYHRNKSP